MVIDVMTFRNNNLNIPQHSQLPRNAPGTQPVLEDYGTPPDQSPGTRYCTLRSIAIPCIPEWNPDTDFFLSKSGYRFGALASVYNVTLSVNQSRSTAGILLLSSAMKLRIRFVTHFGFSSTWIQQSEFASTTTSDRW